MLAQTRANDRQGKKVDIGMLATSEYVNVTTSTLISATHTVPVRITAEATSWIKTGTGTQTAVSGEGLLLIAGQSIAVQIPKNHEVAATAEINIVPWGED